MCSNVTIAPKYPYASQQNGCFHAFAIKLFVSVWIMKKREKIGRLLHTIQLDPPRFDENLTGRQCA